MKVSISKEWLMSKVHLESGEIGAGNPNSEQECYDAWFNELLQAAALNGFTKQSLASFDKQAWKSYFDENYSTPEALREDLSCA